MKHEIIVFLRFLLFLNSGALRQIYKAKLALRQYNKFHVVIYLQDTKEGDDERKV